MMKKHADPIYYIIVGLLVMTLWMNYANYNQIKMLRNNFNNNFYRLQNDVNAVSSDVGRVLNDFKESSMWIRDNSFEVMDFSGDLETAKLGVAIKLNEKNKNEKLYVLAKAINGDEEISFQLPEKDHLNYDLKISLPADYDYEMQLVGENEDYTRSEALESVYLKSYKREIIKIDGSMLGGIYSGGEKEGYYNFFVAVSQLRKGEEMFSGYLKDLEITEIKAEVYYGDRYINTIDFFEGLNYTPMDIEDISDRTPDIIEHHNNMAFEQKYFFSGKYEIKGEPDFPEIMLFVKIKDNKGNSYQEFIGDYPSQALEEKLREH